MIDPENNNPHSVAAFYTNPTIHHSLDSYYKLAGYSKTSTHHKPMVIVLQTD
jgi:hypothetical protein